MIQIQCECGILLQLPDDAVGRLAECPQCKHDIRLVAAGRSGSRDWSNDFSVRLLITSGPDRVGEQVFLGGEGPLTIGKLEGKHVQLAGAQVSRNHCKLVQLGPDQWRIVDDGSRNGCFVNGQRVQRQDLRHGDVLRIGEYELRCSTHAEAMDAASELVERIENAAPPPVPTAAAAAGGGDDLDALYDLAEPDPPKGPAPLPAHAIGRTRAVGTHDRPLSAAAPQRNLPLDGPPCPSCEQRLPRGGKICVQCGIHVPSGRPLLMTKGLDEDALAIRADTWIRILSWFIPFGLFPVASEAFGTRKPYVTWVIAALTIATSTVFLISYKMTDEESVALSNLMLQSGSVEHTQERARQAVDKFNKIENDEAAAIAEPPLSAPNDSSDPTFADIEEELHKFVTDFRAMHASEQIDRGVGFRWYQLLTHAFLHDPGSVLGMLVHLAGNMLFLLVFGTRVNELIGTLKFAIVYLLLAVAAGAVHMLASRNELLTPTIGASGAVMGLAGMYFIFFPVHRVHMAIWFRGGLLTKWQCVYKLFRMPGFWLLVMWIVWNDVLPVFLFKSRWDSTAHWAHLGGFMAGAAVALILLIARLETARGGDILSYALGRHAWPLIGKPDRWRQTEKPASGSQPVLVHS